jgi:DNA-binding NarL/FixJ family response regulator
MSTQMIVLVNESRLLRGILKRAIERDPDLHVVTEVDDYTKVSSVIENADIDWIVLALHPQESIPDVIDVVLRDQPDLRCLVMSTDGSQVQMRWIETHDTSLNEKSLDELLTILRESNVTNRIKERIEI